MTHVSSSLWSVSLCCSKSIPWLHFVKILCWKRGGQHSSSILHISPFNICKFHANPFPLLKLGQTATGCKARNRKTQAGKNLVSQQHCQFHPANWYPGVSLDININTKLKLGQKAALGKKQNFDSRRALTTTAIISILYIIISIFTSLLALAVMGFRGSESVSSGIGFARLSHDKHYAEQLRVRATFQRGSRKNLF